MNRKDTMTSTLTKHERRIAKILYCVAQELSLECALQVDLSTDEVYVMLVELVASGKLELTDVYLHVLGIKKLPPFREVDLVVDLPELMELTVLPDIAKHLFEYGDSNGADTTD